MKTKLVYCLCVAVAVAHLKTDRKLDCLWNLHGICSIDTTIR